jgi:hypothetical protein
MNNELANAKGPSRKRVKRSLNCKETPPVWARFFMSGSVNEMNSRLLCVDGSTVESRNRNLQTAS